MRFMKKLLLLLAISVFVWGCGGSENDGKNTKVAKGNVNYGGVLRLNEVEDFRNLYPQAITEVTSYRIATQIYEGLIKLDQKDLSIIPCIAEKWDINENATSFTFYLRKGVKFHNDACFEGEKGRDVTAKDFKYCFDKLCEADPINQGYWVFENKVKGANEYHKSSLDKKPLPGGVSGVQVIDDYTIKIELNYPFSGFLNLLTTPFCSLFPKEAFDKYGVDMRVKCVGTGPFRVKEIKEGEAVILVRNENYWNIDEFGNQLPYLDAVQCTFIKEKKSELLEFKKGNLDMVFRLPLEMIGDVIGELEQAKSGGNPTFDMQVMPALSLTYYGFQHKSALFNNKKLRLAFNYAIDRDAIVNFTLQGDGTPAKFGIVPPSFKDYNFASLKGYKYDVDYAKKLMAEAGYPNGKGFPELTLQINAGGGRNNQIAEVIQKMLTENLGIKIKINSMPFAQHLENLETGKALFWRTGWSADYPDPENFLNCLYGKHIPANLTDHSYINSVRYSSAKFDSLFELAQKEIDVKKRNELLLLADQTQIDDGAIFPIYYEENTRLVHNSVKNLDQNAMEFRDFTKVYFEKDKTKKAEAKKTE